MEDGEISWTAFCGDRSDYDAFWSPALSLETYNPDVTLCMQRSLLLWIPATWLWIAAIYHIRILLQRKRIHGFFKFSALNLLKTLLGVGLVAVSAVSLYETFTQATTKPPVDYAFEVLRLLTLVLACVFVRWEYMKGLHTSGTLCLFWMFYGILNAISFRSTLIRSSHRDEVWRETEQRLVIDSVFFGLLMAQLVASFFADTTALKSPSTEHLSEERVPLLMKSDSFEKTVPLNLEVPELRASFWMCATFQWMLPAVWRGFRKTVTFDDLYDLRPEDACSRTIPKFYRVFNKNVRTNTRGQLENVKYAFYRALFHTVGWPLVWAISLKFLSVALFLLNPQLLSLMLNFIQTGDPYAWKAGVLSAMIFLVALLGSVVRHNFFYIGWNAGLKARSVVNAVVCRKALRLGAGSKKSTTVGEMVNFLSVDAQKVQDFFTFSHVILDVPVQIVAACILIWNIVGWTAIGGILLLTFVVPMNGFYFGNQIRKLQGKQMIHKDTRLKMINEILNGIKILKLYAWEPSFKKQISDSRSVEVKYLSAANIMNAISHSIWCIMPYLMSLAIFALYVMLTTGHVLSADIAFVTLSYINSFQFALANLPLGVSFAGQGFVSASRIARFLALDELSEDTVETNNTMRDSVQIEDATFSWEADDRVVLEDINVKVKRGELVAIVGHVGAGKTSMLSALLGELSKIKGQVKLNGKLAYVPQQAWIQNTTLRNNILFDTPYIHQKYKKILEACALKHDLDVLPGGDSTEIGEKGINLSGGQKQRVSLARAVYQNEDIYLLDDPLSAVDAHVGKHIFEKVIGKKGILQDKTRILVTHAITFLPHVDRIIVLNEGHVTEMGQYEELLENNGAFADFLRTYLIEEELDDESSAPELVALQRRISMLSGTDSESDMQRRSSATIRRRHQRTGRSQQALLTQSNRMSDAESVSNKRKSGARLIEEETAAIGKMNPRVIWAYVKAGGLPRFCIIILAQLLFVSSQVLTNLWLSAWTNDVPVNGTFSLEHAQYRLGVYGGLGFLQTVSAVLLMVFGMMGCTSASREMHKLLLFKILRAPMSFFDTTPLGRIMNRFSKDMDMLDANVPIYLRTWLFATGPLLSAIILISYTTPIFLVLLFVLMFPYGFLQRVYITYGSQLKRIDSIRRSPIYAHFDETVSGATSIRAYRREEDFIAKAEQLIDNSQKPFFILSAAQRWLGVTLETLGSLVILAATLLAALSRDSIGPGLAGVSVTYALQITTLLNMTIRSSTELETYMVCVERIDEYTQVQSEAPWSLPSDHSDRLSDWPSEGQVNFRKYGTRYRPGLDLVLSDVDLDMEPGEKVGVIGRTGAGKSSLTLALFRIIEAAQGQIAIDGENLSGLGLHLLRRKLTVIPQDPVMFSGSLRMNLDPFGTYSELDLWQALEHAHLKTFVETLEEGLDYNCGEGGDALSVGQRQLVCLARALLRQSRVLILDEATAAVDLETDALIQASIREHFDRCTVITVAHRLNTVLDYDKILVLDLGKVKEFDTPTNLLADKSSIFYSLAKEAGLV